MAPAGQWDGAQAGGRSGRRHQDGVWLAVILAACLLPIALRDAAAQRITIDGSLAASGGAAAQSLVGPNYQIGANLGVQRGANLFHSFGKFGLNTGESATFGGPGTVSNIVGRVTGGAASSIDGAIKSTINGANLFLINPSGIVFGPNATVNISGSFHASTADYLRMQDGAKFQATNPSGSTLSAAAPAAFGFLNATPGNIAVNGSALGVPSGKTLGLVGGPVSVTGGALSAPAGTIHLSSAAGVGEIPVDPLNTPALTTTSFGRVGITNSSTLNVSDQNGRGSGGSVFIRAGTLDIDASEINADNAGAGSGGQIALRGESQITIDNNSYIHALALAAGPGPGIVIATGPNAGNLTIDNNALIATGSIASGRNSGAVGSGGAIAITIGGALTMANGAAVESFQDVPGPRASTNTANSGNIAVSAASIALSGGAQIFTDAIGTGAAGDIVISASGDLRLGSQAAIESFGAASNSLANSNSGFGARGGSIAVNAGSITLLDGSIIASDTFGAGRSGNIALTATGDLILNSAGSTPQTGIFVDSHGRGAGGSISLVAQNIRVLGGADITSDSFFSGDSGTISVIARGNLLMDGAGTAPGNTNRISTDSFNNGKAGSLSIGAQSLILLGASQITSDAVAGTGNAGDIAISAHDVTVAQGSTIATATLSAGNGGQILVTTSGPLDIVGSNNRKGTGISSSAEAGSSGNGGKVIISAGDLSISGGAAIASTTAGPGHGGDIGVTIAGAASLTGAAADGTASAITAAATAGSTGAAGEVKLSVGGALSLSGGAQVSSATSGKGNGGTVQVTVQGDLELRDPGTGIVASANATAGGNAGSVMATASQIRLLSGAQIASTTAGTGAGGSVSVTTAGQLLIDGMGIAGTQIAASATGPRSGPGGAVTASAGSLTVQDGGRIASTTDGLGRGGDIDLSVRSDTLLSGLGPQITAKSSGVGDAGSITLAAANLRMTDGAAISTEAATANGGNIALHVAHFMRLADSKITTSVHGSVGNGGNILIDPQFLILQHSEIIAQAVRGHGGNITIIADEYLPSADSIVSASSELGISGAIDIVGPRVDLNGTLVILSSELRGAQEVLRNSCAARSAVPRSSLTEAGRGGLPQDPETMLLALYVADRDFASGPAPAGRRTDAGKAALTAVRLSMHCAGSAG